MWQVVGKQVRRVGKPVRGVAVRLAAMWRLRRRLKSEHREALASKQEAEERLDQVLQELNHIRVHYETWVPTGHFYSPYPDLDEVGRRSESIFDPDKDLIGVDLRAEQQRALFDELVPLIEHLPFPANKGDEYRYFFDNPAYSWSDGMILHGMLRHLQPRRVVEIGSGYSSAMTLDTTEHWLDGNVELTFVEPYTDLLRSLLRPGDERRATIVEQPVQEVDLDLFTSLVAGDVLFIDSTHVAKAGSDVNHLYFEVLPRLAEGVWVHIHDIFHPFEYSQEWVHEGRAWHEVYVLHAMLMFTEAFQIEWFQDYMWRHHRSTLEGRLPLMAKNPGGNLWLTRSQEAK